ncbi:hypothetical protein AAFF_G00081470 [Aldrovandia affinis]|uniref:Uncharacterized protein n=1 Tax=Aldrovandia affinis TaxID=143900 RepID=A0AAD7WYH4_9TELE|nr:hypothetical protein AAFF_G00081470 [Aldrovandia affinis]
MPRRTGALRAQGRYEPADWRAATRHGQRALPGTEAPDPLPPDYPPRHFRQRVPAGSAVILPETKAERQLSIQEDNGHRLSVAPLLTRGVFPKPCPSPERHTRHRGKRLLPAAPEGASLSPGGRPRSGASLTCAA